MKYNIVIILYLYIIHHSLAQSNIKLDYADLKLWAAHPDKKDSADCTPPGLIDRQADAQVDVFFIHPTSYGGYKGKKPWNADINDDKINFQTDAVIIKNQATVFNEYAKVYCPRYRQAHYYVFLTKDAQKKKQALDFAYQDIRNAFQYYLDHYNRGRPIIIASHSQGTIIAVRLLQEFFDDTNLQNRLVVAYLPGMPVSQDEFKNLHACKDENQTNCICSWRTYKDGKNPSWGSNINNLIVTNPLSWKTDYQLAGKEYHKGMILFHFDEPPIPHAIQARSNGKVLWINKPKFKGSLFVTKKNYHRGDYNLFYVNIRENVGKRINAFWKG